MENKLLLSIVTPERPLVENKPVDFAVLPAYEGEMGILPGHISFVVQLKEGILRYREGSAEEYFSVHGGFAEIHGGRISVFAETGELAKEIDEERARQSYQKAKDALSMRGEDIDLDSAQAALRRAAVRLKIAELKKRRK
ncbi:MAG: ATP synthase F1 subunit epsilon [Elusimicrobia bacterium]|nr:ATP synthase F1 subunit epsilon [Elusimicrobiota bacterium]